MTFLELVLDFSLVEDEAAQKQFAAQKLGIDVSQITHIRIRKRSLDARRKEVKVRLQAEVFSDESARRAKRQRGRELYFASAARDGISRRTRRQNRGGFARHH